MQIFRYTGAMSYSPTKRYSYNQLHWAIRPLGYLSLVCFVCLRKGQIIWSRWPIQWYPTNIRRVNLQRTKHKLTIYWYTAVNFFTENKNIKESKMKANSFPKFGIKKVLFLPSFDNKLLYYSLTFVFQFVNNETLLKLTSNVIYFSLPRYTYTVDIYMRKCFY